MGTLANRAETEAAAPSPKQVIAQMLEANANAIADSLPEGMDAKRFRRLLLTATTTNPKLLECDPFTFLRAGVLSAQLGLEPNDPRELAWLLPIRDRNNRYGQVVDFRIGWRGLAQLAFNAGASPIIPQPVFPGDRFHDLLGSKPKIIHEPDPTAEGYWKGDQLVATYAVSRVRSDTLSVVLYRVQIEERRAKSPARDAGPWRSDYIAMARKSAVRELCKFLPQSTELALAVDADDRGIEAADVDLPLPEAVADGADYDAIEAEWTEAPAVDPETGEVADDVVPDAPEYAPDDPERPF